MSQYQPDHNTLGAAPVAAAFAAKGAVAAAKPILATAGKIAAQLLRGLLNNPWKDLGTGIKQLNNAADATLNHARKQSEQTSQLLKYSKGQLNQSVKVTQAVRNATPPPPKKDNTMTYVMVGTATLTAIGIGVAILKS